METGTQALKVTRRSSELGEWEMVYRAPAARLRPFVHPYNGYTEQSAAFATRRQVPGVIVPVIINLGPPLDVSEPGQPGRLRTFDEPFVAGLHASHTIVQSAGEQHGIQVNFSPIGARLLFGMPMDELANQVTDLAEVLGPGGRELIEQLRETQDWETRFALLDAAIVQRFARAAAPSEAVAWAWTRLVAAGGNLDIGCLADDMGWSGRRLIAEFRDQLGLPPKLLGRIVRFNRARLLLEQEGGRRCWADIAGECGYYDQAHFSREFREFAGTSPREYLRMRMPDGHGVSAAAGT